MIDASTVPAGKLRFTMRMIRDQALARGWKVWMYYVGSAHMRVQRTDGKILELYSATPPTTSYAAGHRANDKFFTHVALQEAGLPLPETYLVDNLEDATKHAKAFIKAGKQLVTKPLDAGHGKGVTVELRSLGDLPRAFAYAQEFARGVIMQECVTHPVDVRITCIGYTYIAGLVRVPARVKGDGINTVGQLIDLENKNQKRGENYARELNVISKTQAGLYLGEKINDVPQAGEYVSVLGTANVGTGGETIDVTDDIPGWLRAMAERAAREMQLPTCGVDFLLDRMPQAADTPQNLTARIIEINKCPALFLHETPTYGKPRPATAAYLDYLETL